MTPDELAWLGIADLGPLLARRQLSPVALCRALLDRCERLEPQLHAFITLSPDRILAEAEAAGRELAAGRVRGPLHGVPIAVKDLCWTRGERTTGGSKVLADFVPDEDGTVVARLRAAGAIVFGKTNTPEFAYGPLNQYHYGPSHNPWDVGRFTGGSSMGAAAALAGGLAPGAIGSDTGGSIRGPGLLVGGDGAQAHLWPRPAAWRRGAGDLARPRRPDGALGARLRAPPRRPRRGRSARRHHGRGAGAGLRGRADRTGPGPPRRRPPRLLLGGAAGRHRGSRHRRAGDARPPRPRDRRRRDPRVAGRRGGEQGADPLRGGGRVPRGAEGPGGRPPSRRCASGWRPARRHRRRTTWTRSGPAPASARRCGSGSGGSICWPSRAGTRRRREWTRAGSSWSRSPRGTSCHRSTSPAFRP